MDTIALTDIRYGLAAILVVLLPVVIVFWVTIHGAVSFWKSRPMWQAYTAALLLMLATATPVLWRLDAIIGQDLGTLPGLFVVGTIIYFTSWRMSARIRPHLDLRTFSGIPEVQGEAEALIEAGPFSVVRHPRYFMIIVGTIGWAIAANYSGAYVISGLFFLALYLVIQMEENELVGRFGDKYRNYKTRVPMVFPRLKRIGQLFA
ncbi:MAG: isoprenylcysteine carboxylmethyltransferase family protein [Pseudomonadota bacterium]